MLVHLSAYFFVMFLKSYITSTYINRSFYLFKCKLAATHVQTHWANYVCILSCGIMWRQNVSQPTHIQRKLPFGVKQQWISINRCLKQNYQFWPRSPMRPRSHEFLARRRARTWPLGGSRPTTTWSCLRNVKHKSIKRVLKWHFRRQKSLENFQCPMAQQVISPNHDWNSSWKKSCGKMESRPSPWIKDRRCPTLSQQKHRKNPKDKLSKEV